MLEFVSLFLIPFVILISYLIWTIKRKPKQERCSYCLDEWARPFREEEIYLGKDDKGNTIIADLRLCNSCYKGYLFNPEGFIIELKGLLTNAHHILIYTKESE